MVPAYEVKCINKAHHYSPYERITAVGGMLSDLRLWKISQEEAIAGIETGRFKLYVKQGGRIADVIVARSRFGNKYLKTTADGESPDNLLNLTECYQ